MTFLSPRHNNVLVDIHGHIIMTFQSFFNDLEYTTGHFFFFKYERICLFKL